jgi:hypothetical protein
MTIRIRVPDGYRYRDDFLSVSVIRIRLKLRWVRGEYFFSPVGNPTGTRYFTTVMILVCEQVKICSLPVGTRYFTTVMILVCEQVKICSFCDINYNLF